MNIFDPNFDYAFFDESVPEAEYETPSLDSSIGYLIAGFSSRGIKNKIVENRTRGELKSNFGDDFVNFDKYGQANLHAMRLATSKARVFFCSLCPDDAKVAYSVFGVSLQTNNKIPVYKRTDTVLSADNTMVLNYGSGSFVLDSNGEKIQLEVKVNGTPAQGTENEEGYVPAVPEGTKLVTTSGVVLKTETVTLQNTSWFDQDGNPTGYTGEPLTLDTGKENERTFYPLFSIYYYSRGKGGNYFAYRIMRQTNRDKKSVDGRRYTMYFYELLSSGSYKPLYNGEDFNFSFNRDAVYSTADSTSEFLGNVYTNIDEKSENKPLQLTVYNDSYEALLDAIVAAGANEESSKYDIDVLNCVFKNGNEYNKIVEPSDSIDIENTIITLDHGTDGSIEVGNTVKVNEVDTVVTAEMAAAKKEELLIKFFSCDVDDDIFDEKITDIDVLPDENYSMPVKQAIMTKFSKWRPDIHLGMDFGTDVKTPEESISKCRELNTFVNNEWSFMVSFYGQAGLLSDKAIDSTPRVVTATYDWAAGLADNFASGTGAFSMRAGANRGRVSYFKPYWVGKKNKANTLETLEDLHINNIQYLNKQKQLVYMLEDTQYEVSTSKMMSVRNSIVVGRIIRMCAGVTPYFKFDERNIDVTMDECKAELRKNVKLAKIPANIQVEFDIYQTKADQKEENAHIGIDITFPNYIKKFHVEIRAHRPQIAGE